MTEITLHEAQVYFMWSIEMLMGSNPIQADNYLKENMSDIKKVARAFLERTNYKPCPIHRGVILQEANMELLAPHPNFTYVSFTEDMSIANKFADPEDEMAFMVRMRMGANLHGYIAEYTPSLDEILFHWNFFKLLPYQQFMVSHFGVDGTTAPLQKEVTLLQPEKYLRLTPFKKQTLNQQL
jgi:hypothetical protein